MNCGTEKGLLQHKARNEPPCRWCLPFRADGSVPAVKRRPGPPKGTIPTGNVGRPLAPCGTPSAARRHLDRGEPVDDACRDAQRTYKAAWREAKRQQAKEITDGL